MSKEKETEAKLKEEDKLVIELNKTIQKDIRKQYQKGIQQGRKEATTQTLNQVKEVIKTILQDYDKDGHIDTIIFRNELYKKGIILDDFKVGKKIKSQISKLKQKQEKEE